MQAVLNTSPLARSLARPLVAVALLLVWPGPLAQTVPTQILPTGMKVVSGQASATLSGLTLTVRNTPDTILYWGSFSIGVENTVRFEQDSALSQVLNRVTGTDPSSILGSLSSNGRVWLLNPNGVLFGQGARVDVAGLVVSTLNLNDTDWLTGRYLFSGSAPAAVVNQGTLSSLGGRVVLLGGRVENQGSITASGGQVVLAGGEQVELIDTGAPNLSVRLGVAAASAVLNAGSIDAAAGRIDIHAASVNQQGIVRAGALTQGTAGQIVLSATGQLDLGAGSRTSADGLTGGSVTLEGGGGIQVSGSVQALGSGGQGGTLTLRGGPISLDGAALETSGSLTLDGRGRLDIQNSSLSAGGPIRAWSDSIRLSGESFLGSNAQGDAIVLAGPGGTGPMASFTNEAGSGVLAGAPEFGRWIVFNNDASATGFVPGGLVNGFTRYGATANAWSADAGNGFVFATEPAATVATRTAPGLREPLALRPIGPWLSGTAVSTDQSGVLDVTPTDPGSRSASSSGADFGQIAIADLSQEALLAVLAARDRHKKNLLAEALQQLERQPGLADLRPCRHARETEEGVCLMTPELQRTLQAATLTERPPTPPQAAASVVPAARAAVAGTAPALQPLAVQVVPRHRVKVAALPQIRRKLALVIGVDRYADASIPALANAVSDARAMAHLFETTLGYDTVVLENASKAAVVRALNRMTLELGPNDSAIIYYAGHGELVRSTGLGYWLLSDSDARSAGTWLSNTDISRLIGQIGASQVALISDSCYSGSLVSEERIRAMPGQIDPDPVLARKTVVVMSSGGNEPVFDAGKQGHSLFAWHLMQTLEQVTRWQPGGRVFERVRFAVARALPQRPQYGAARVAEHQPGSDYLFEQRSLEIGK